MNKKTLTIIIVVLFCVLAFLTILLMIKKSHKNAMMKASSATALSPVPTSKVPPLSKKYISVDGQFQFQYPESWFLVETSQGSIILASDASIADSTTPVGMNGVKIQMQFEPAVTGVHLNNFVQCDPSAKGCDIVSFNGQPYKVTEMTSATATLISYETIRGTKTMEADVTIGEGAEKIKNIEILTAIVTSFYWK